MELLDYLRVLRRRWRLLAASVAAALLVGWVSTPEQAAVQSIPAGTSYRATHTLLQSADTQEEVNLELTKLFATTGEIPRRAAVRLGKPPEQGPFLAAQVTATADVKVGSLAISVAGSDGTEAAAIANAFAVEIVESLRETAQADRAAEQKEATNLVEVLGDRVAQLQSQIKAGGADEGLLTAQRDAYLENYSAAFSRLQAIASQGAPRSPLATLEQAVPVPVVASSVFTPPSSRLGRVTLAGLMGLLLGALLALLLERVDRRLRSREAVEDITSLPVVAEIPVLPRKARRDWSIPTVTAPASAVAEAFRSLRSAVMLVPSRPALQQPGPDIEWRTPKVLLVTSPLPSDGKTTTVANLAACLSESGRQVLVLDCDFRNPTLHRYFQVPAGRGMSDLLAATSGTEVAHVVRATSVPGVRLVTSGSVTDHPAALLARAGDLLDAARELADVVLIDAAPVLAANDATDLVPYVDAVVLVARCGRTTRDHALRTTELLARLSVPIAGTVLIASNGSIKGYTSRLPGVLGWLPLRRGSAQEPPRDWTGQDEDAPRHSRRARHRPTPRSPGAPRVVRPAPAPLVPNGTGWPTGGPLPVADPEHGSDVTQAALVAPTSPAAAGGSATGGDATAVDVTPVRPTSTQSMTTEER